MSVRAAECGRTEVRTVSTQLILLSSNLFTANKYGVRHSCKPFCMASSYYLVVWEFHSARYTSAVLDMRISVPIERCALLFLARVPLPTDGRFTPSTPNEAALRRCSSVTPVVRAGSHAD